MKRWREHLYPIAMKTTHGEKWGYIDDSGRVRISPTYDQAEAFQANGLAVVMLGEKYGLINRFGHDVVQPIYTWINPFSDGRAIAQQDDGTNVVIDESGRTLQTYPYAYVGSFSEGLMSFQKDTDGKAGYIDEKGDVVIKPAFDVALPFTGDRAIIGLKEGFDTHYGLIDRSGKVVIAPHYNEVRDLGDERYALGEPLDPKQPFLGNSFALATKDGELLSDFVYTDIEPFVDGVASVAREDETFLINDVGQKASPAFEGAGAMKNMNGLWQVFINNRISYYDDGGDLVWKPETVIPLRQSYQIKEKMYRPDPNYIVYYPEIEGMTDNAQERRLNEKLKEWSQVKTVPKEQLKEAAYTGDFQVKFFKKYLLVLELTGYNYPFGAAHGMPTKMYVNIDLRNGHVYQLADLFQPNTDYVTVLNQYIEAQIAHDPAHADIFADEFKTIAPDQSFYVDDEALYIVFPVYAIAPFVAGFPTFKIPFSELIGLIDEQGPFWTSFHAAHA